MIKKLQEKGLLTLIPFTLLGLVVLFISILAIPRASATGNNQVCFCHNVNNNPHTICTSNQGQINGHLKHVKNGDDYSGRCIEPSPTPTGTPEPSGEPTSAPEPTATPTLAPQGEDKGKFCTETKRPYIVWVDNDGSTVKVTWDSVGSSYVVEYKIDGVVYNTTSTNPYLEIHYNGVFQGVRVASVDNTGACTGEFSDWSTKSLPSGNK